MGMVQEQVAFTNDVARLIRYAREIGVYLTFGEAFRTNEQQEIYMKTGKTTVKHSRHQDRLAVDFNFFVMEDGKMVLDYNHPKVAQLGRYWESLHDKNRWGGHWTSFRDTPHFERRRS